MAFSTNSSIEYRFRGTPNSNNKILEVRFGYSSRLISRSPFPENIPDQIFQQIPSTVMGESVFPFRDLQTLKFDVYGFLCSLNLHPSVCEIICHKILSFAQEFDTINGSFKIEANINYITDLIWNTEVVPVGDEEFSPPATRSGAPESAIERIKKQKFDAEDLGDCCVCCEDLKEKREEVSRIPCGHVYHKSCILTWLGSSNSCPLCRTPLQP